MSADLFMKVIDLGPPPEGVLLRDFFTEHLGHPEGEQAFREIVLSNVRAALSSEDNLFVFAQSDGTLVSRHPDVFGELFDAEASFNQAIRELIALSCKQNPTEEDSETLQLLIKEVSEPSDPEHGDLNEWDTSYLWWAFWELENRPSLAWRILKNQMHSLVLDQPTPYQRT